MNTQILEQCMAASFANTPFPVVVGRLAEAGVTSYSADLVTLRKTYYNSGKQSRGGACRSRTRHQLRPRSTARVSRRP